MRTATTTTHRTLAHARVLLALAMSAMGIVGCQQAELPLNNADGTQGGQPISVSIAPKQAFSTDGGAETRGTTDPSTGAFEWSAKDVIYVKYTFDTKPDATIVYHYWQNVGGTTNNSYVDGWATYTGWAPITAVSTMTWPVGAPTCTVQAFYTDYSHNAWDTTRINFKYQEGATGDIMIFEQSYKVDEPIKVDMKHITSRLTFTGLTKGTVYGLKLNGVTAQPPSGLNTATWKLTTLTTTGLEPAATTADDTNGTFTFCLPLDGEMDTQNRVAIEVMTTETNPTAVMRAELTGTPVVDGTNTTYHIDGKRYTITPSNGTGSITPENNPDLIL